MSSQFIFYTVSFCLGFFMRSVFSHLFMIGTYIKYMQDIEKKFILLSASFIQWKAQSIAILEIVYQHKVRHSEEQKQEFVEIKQKIEEKYDNIAEYYVNDIKKILPYKTEYKNFKEAVKHLQKKDV